MKSHALLLFNCLLTLSSFCSSLGLAQHHTEVDPLSLEDTTTSCTSSYYLGSSLFDHRLWAAAYDTLRSAIERCPTNPLANGAFGDMAGAVQRGALGKAPDCYGAFRSWCLKALAWNSSPSYFCADVEAISSCMQSSLDTSWASENYQTNRGLAVIQWLIQNGNCEDPTMRNLYVDSRGDQRETWIARNDTSKVALDTTLPSMHDLGLDSVLLFASKLGVIRAAEENPITSAVAMPNPSSTGTLLTFGLNHEGYVTVEVFDQLGNEVSGVQFAQVIQAGNHSVPIDTRSWLPGTYFARITSTYGGVRTVTLVKE